MELTIELFPKEDLCPSLGKYQRSDDVELRKGIDVLR